MFVVGITGGIGSGKSALTTQLQQFGIHVVDADIVAREVVQPGTPALRKISSHFGSDILNRDGELDRASLRQRVFSHPEDRQWLETLLHPIIRAETIKQLKQASSPYTILASPLLLETDQHELTQHIVLVDVPIELQINRTMARDNNNEEQVRAIIAAQMSREEKQQRANTIINNDADLQALYNQAADLHKTLQRLAQQEKISE